MKQLSSLRRVIGNHIALLVCVLLFTTSLVRAQSTHVLTNDSILAMKSQKIDKDLIKTKISLYACKFSIDDNSLSKLQKANVEIDVIQEMMKKSAPGATPVPTAAPTVTLAPREDWGKIKKGMITNKKGKPEEVNMSYTSEKGTRVFKLGDTIELGGPTRMANIQYSFIRKSWCISRCATNLVKELAFLNAENTGRFEILGIDKSRGIEAHNIYYLYIHIPSVGDCEIAVEAALRDHEIQ